jgi:hypothetical protein
MKSVMCCGGCEPKCGNCFVQVEVEMTDEEVAQMEADAASTATAKAEQEAALAAQAEAKASAEAKLAALGLTPEEISAL